MPRRSLLPHVREEFLRLAGAGWTDVALAAHFGVSPTTVAGWRRRLGLPCSPGWGRRRPLPATTELGTYTDEQAAWLRAIDQWRARHGRPPTLREAFRLALAMGYRRSG